MATALALLASLLWGSADFLGGTASRRLPATAVVAVSQGAAMLGLAVVAAAAGSYGDDPGYIGWALAAAVVGVVALVCFYAALAEGTMGVVAPIAATGIVVPVGVGIAQGDRPDVLQVLGLVVAFVGVFLAAGPEGAGGAAGQSRPPVVLAAVAAAGFGSVLVFIAHGAQSSTVMTLLTMRFTSVGLLVLLALVGCATVSARRSDLPLLALVGAGDVGANAAMAVASTRGLLSVVAVLSSLYPAVTVVLARAVHGERLSRVQLVGVTAALAGVALIASGGGVSS
ncbi:MAG TPA: EamA family transporter [Mycobacteriales bacterium]|nr:EamA family transporter [Mycobacteriales bacterium]